MKYFVRILFITLFLVIYVAVIVLLLVNSVTFATFSPMIKFRHKYYTYIRPRLGNSMSSLPFEIMPMLEARGESGYVYTMLGKFVGVDTVTK